MLNSSACPKIIAVIVKRLNIITRMPARHAEYRKRVKVVRLGVLLATSKDRRQLLIDISEALGHRFGKVARHG